MQPTLFPWSGYLGLMMNVDKFIYLDTVQFSRRSWQQRNQIKTNNGAEWITIPVIAKGKRDQIIKDVVIDNTSNFNKKIQKTITSAYIKSKNFNCSEAVFEILNNENLQLSNLNIEIIDWIKQYLEIETQTIYASSLENRGAKADLLAHLCEQVGADEYISPLGSQEYLEQSNIFETKNIKLSYFQYNHPIYKQLHGDFLPNMSSIDLIFNEGQESINIIKESIITGGYKDR